MMEDESLVMPGLIEDLDASSIKQSPNLRSEIIQAYELANSINQKGSFTTNYHQPDHIHCLEANPFDSPANIVKIFKAYSTRMDRKFPRFRI